MEKALVAGELESEQEKLAKEEQICDHLKEQIIDLEENYIKQREIVSLHIHHIRATLPWIIVHDGSGTEFLGVR